MITDVKLKGLETTKKNVLDDYDLRTKELVQAVNAFVLAKRTMSQGPKWEAFDEILEEFQDIIDRPDLIEMCNRLIRAKGLAK